MRVSIPYGVIEKTHPNFYDSEVEVFKPYEDLTVRAYEWKAAKDFWKCKRWVDKAYALVFVSSAFVALLTRGRYHVRIGFYHWESSVG